jgi:hypothetical protein
MNDVYGYWRARLAGLAGDGISPDHYLPTLYDAGHPDNPQPGLYRTRLIKGGPRVPVQIWLADPAGNVIHSHIDGCELRATIDGKSASRDDIANRWHFCEAVSKTDFAHYKQTGQWPGEIAIGHNSGDLSLADEVAEAVKMAGDWLAKTKIADKTTADMAANMRSRLLELGKKVDAERDAKKRPHLEAGRAIDAEYKPIVESATIAANAIRDALTAWMRAEEARQRAEAEAKRRAEMDRHAAEMAKREAMNPLEQILTPEPEMLPLPDPEAVKVQAGGQRGRKAGLRTVMRYEVRDYAAALAHVSHHPDVRAAVEAVCVKLCKAGAAVPGVEKFEEKVAA